MRKIACLLAGVALLLSGGCGYKLGYRHFTGPVLPAPELEQEAGYVVGDDRSITYLKDRLEISLLPLTTEMLNRQFAAESAAPKGFSQANPYATARNPYTYGGWKPPEEEQTPERFTIFLLKVKNYAYPKVRIDPETIAITAPNGRRYQALSLLALVEYYWPYAVAYAGNSREGFVERRDLLRRTLFNKEVVFSGQEKSGYIVFPALDRDVTQFTVWIEDMALRFDYQGEPVEEIDIPYRFRREVYLARKPHLEQP